MSADYLKNLPKSLVLLFNLTKTTKNSSKRLFTIASQCQYGHYGSLETLESLQLPLRVFKREADKLGWEILEKRGSSYVIGKKPKDGIIVELDEIPEGLGRYEIPPLYNNLKESKHPKEEDSVRFVEKVVLHMIEDAERFQDLESKISIGSHPERYEEQLQEISFLRMESYLEA